MAREIPEVVRAVAGLAATVLDEARKLPETLPGLPVRLVGQALQVSLKLQQQYSGLVARGDEVFTGLHGDDEQGFATFDDDLPAPRPPAGTPAPRSSAFDLVGDLPADAVDEGLADELADDLAVAGLAVADPDALADEVAVLTVSPDEEADLTPAEVAELPADPIADAVTAVVDELAAEVADELAEDVPYAAPEQLLEELTAEVVTESAEQEVAAEEAAAEAAQEAADDDAFADAVADELIADELIAAELIADAAVGGAPPVEQAAGVPTLGNLSADQAPQQTELVDDAAPAVAAVEDAAEELVDLGGPEAAESVTPGSDITDSKASDPLVASAETTPEPAADTAPEPAADTAPEPAPEPAADAAPDPAGDAGTGSGPTSPVEGYDSFSIPALRGHLRAYPAETVADLLDYERATRARAPFVTLLQNRLEKLSIDRG